MNGIDAYSRPRARSAEIISFRRSNLSARTPAKDPKITDGESLASMTPATARAPSRLPPSRATSAATATNPTQSPREETSMARHRREKEGWVRRSLSVAGLVPLSAAISSATEDAAAICLGAPLGPGAGSRCLTAPRRGRASPARSGDQRFGLLLGQLLSCGVPGPAARDAAGRAPASGDDEAAAGPTRI